MHHNNDLPPISNLLLREADAWRAVLVLHSATVNTAHQLAHVPDNQPDSSLRFEDERKMNSDCREASYCSALTGLASQCDNLIAEVLKLRTFRKSRRTMEVLCLKEIVRSHSDEILAVGQTLSSNGSLNVASATAELRVAIQNQRSQVSQLRLLLEAVKSVETLPLPKDGRIVIGVSIGESEPVTHDLDSVMSSVFNEARELNDSSLSTALSSLFGGGGHSARQSRQFARRAVERAAGSEERVSAPD